jgi:hypothetical protein
MGESFGIKVRGVAEAQGAVRKIAAMRGLRRGVQAGALHLKGKMAVYPPKNRPTRASVYGKSFVNYRQQQAVMAKLKSGDAPYKRGISGGSEAFGRRWTTETRDGGLVGVVGNNASYGEYVMGDEQSKYMGAVGWEKASDIAKREEGDVRRIVEAEVAKDVEK